MMVHGKIFYKNRTNFQRAANLKSNFRTFGISRSTALGNLYVTGFWIEGSFVAANGQWSFFQGNYFFHKTKHALENLDNHFLVKHTLL